MAITAAGEEVTAAETSPPNDVVTDSVDFKGRPSVRSKSGCWKSAFFIAGFEMAERFCYYGVSSNLVNYLTIELGQSTAAAAANLNAWYGTAALSPVLGALLADSHFGRFRMIVFSSLLYMLVGSSLAYRHLGQINLMWGMQKKRGQKLVFQLVVLVFLPRHRSSPIYCHIHSRKFELGDWIRNPFCRNVLVVGCLLHRFTNLPVQQGDEEEETSVFENVCVFGKRRYPPQVESLDKALLALSDSSDHETDNIGDDGRDAKAMLRLVPIWCTTLGYSIVYAQPSTLFTKQAASMDRHMGPNFEIPSASFQLCISLTIMLFVSLYDRIFVPIVRSITKKPAGITVLQRIGVGLVLSLLSIVIAAVVEAKSLTVACEHGLVDRHSEMVPMSVWWLAPQYTLSGISDVFGMVGLQEFFYDQVPSELKSTGLALYLSILGVGSLASSFLVSVIQNATSGHGRDGWFSDNLNRAQLDYFYWLMAGLSAVSLVAYVYFAKHYVFSVRLSVGRSV